MPYYNSEDFVNSFKRSLTSSESDYAGDCWVVFKMVVESGKIVSARRQMTCKN